ERGGETVGARMNAALVLGLQHKHREAAEQFQAIAERDRATLSEDDPRLAQDLYNWAATLQNAGDDAAAEPILRELLDHVEQHHLEAERFVPAPPTPLPNAPHHP